MEASLHNYDSKLLGDAAEHVPAHKPAFAMPCREFFLQSCAFGDRRSFDDSPLTVISDEDFEAFITIACPRATSEWLEKAI